MTKYAAFDLELWKELPNDSSQWDNYRPFGISAAAILLSDTEEPLFYSARDAFLRPTARKMEYDEVHPILRKMEDLIDVGYRLVGWNSLGFDFKVLGEEAGDYELAAKLARNHVDPMFEIVCRKGYPLGLDAVSKFMVGEGKVKEFEGQAVSGKDFAKLWKEEKFAACLEYLKGDVVATLKVAEAIEKRGMVEWISRRGTVAHCPHQMLSCVQSNQIPLPDTSWLKGGGFSRQEFYSWFPEGYDLEVH